MHYGLWFLFAIVCLESAGLWVPGETALIAAGVYASKGHLSISAVIVVVPTASVVARPFEPAALLTVAVAGVPDDHVTVVVMFCVVVSV